jgi:hypothetical protein
MTVVGLKEPRTAYPVDLTMEWLFRPQARSPMKLDGRSVELGGPLPTP